MHMKSKTTGLYGWHVAHGANMIDFGEYKMPLWYPSGAKMEHLAVLRRAGIFDTSHMAVLTVSGAGAFEMLQGCFTKDLRCCVGQRRSPLVPGKCVYGAFLHEEGGVIDDALVYHLGEKRFMLVVNAGMGEEIRAHLTAHGSGGDMEITDHTDRVGKIDLQGVSAGHILRKVLARPEGVLKDMPYFSFKGHFEKTAHAKDPVTLVDGTPVLLSRTGYTGEFGFEIFLEPSRLGAVWELMLDAGDEYDLIPCGLAARDSLRTGAMLPLSHQDIGHWPFVHHPWPFALPYRSDRAGFTKAFIGGEALLNITQPNYTYAYVGDDLRKISGHHSAVVLNLKGVRIGHVLSCVTDMAIGRLNGRIYSISSPGKSACFQPKGLCCGFVRVNRKLDFGHTVYLKDGRREIRGTIVADIRPDRTARKPMREMLA